MLIGGAALYPGCQPVMTGRRTVMRLRGEFAGRCRVFGGRLGPLAGHFPELLQDGPGRRGFGQVAAALGQLPRPLSRLRDPAERRHGSLPGLIGSGP